MEMAMDEIEAAIPATPPKKHRSLTPRVLLQIAVAVLVLAGAGFGGYYYLSQRGAADAQTTAYVEVPTLPINLRSADGRARFLRVRIVLETPAEATTELNARMQALVDAMQGFFRALRPYDLAGARKGVGEGRGWEGRVDIVGGQY